MYANAKRKCQRGLFAQNHCWGQIAQELSLDQFQQDYFLLSALSLFLHYLKNISLSIAHLPHQPNDDDEGGRPGTRGRMASGSSTLSRLSLRWTSGSGTQAGRRPGRPRGQHA